MGILLTNDDGIYADGLWALYRALSDHYRVGVVAPDRERSAAGHAITLNEPLRKQWVALNGGYSGVAVTGTPADCVKLGMRAVFDSPPRLVISGINPGANVGINVNYSGTVAAAREAALYGVSAMSISIGSRQPQHLNEVAGFVAYLARQVFERGLMKGTFLNVNTPDLPLAEIAGVRVSRHRAETSGGDFEKRIDPCEKPYYWQGCDKPTRTEATDQMGALADTPEVDTGFLTRGYITITPLKCDATDYTMLDQMQSWNIHPAG